MGTADGAMGGSYGAREFGAGDWAGARWRRSGGSHWSAFEIIAMVLGFIVFWPIGLAILGYKFWQRRYGGPDLQTLATNKWQDARTMMSGNSSSWGCGAVNRARGYYGASTGNAAFNEWRTAELTRLDEERRKLDEAQRVRRILRRDPPRQGSRGVRSVHGRTSAPSGRRAELELSVSGFFLSVAFRSLLP
jgi:hypothetical protein